MPIEGMQERINKAWDDIVKAVNKLLDAHQNYGFLHFREGVHPSLEDMLKGFEVIEFVLNTLLESDKLNFDEDKSANNQKQCIWLMKLLSTALQNKDEEQYNQIIRLLEKQPTYQ